ncbi:MAG: GtrA family protein [Bacteroides sp.]|nr:GtrA family protein [Bacteroides sp.]MCM1456807.1 GtrA family protein [Lachnoclostridium sp.]
MKRDSLLQLVKYGVVGCLNTALTLGIIFVCKSFLGVDEYLSNALGYVAGFVNSFLWNRRWVFRSDGRLRREAALFLCGFAVCYCVQFAVVWVLSRSPFGDMEYAFTDRIVLSGYGIATLIGNVAYTLSNFIFNKVVTFGSARD